MVWNAIIDPPVPGGSAQAAHRHCTRPFPGESGLATRDYHQDAFFELAREIREAKFYRQVASRLNQREKVRLNTVQSPKLLGRQFHRDTCGRRETRVAI